MNVAERLGKWVLWSVAFGFLLLVNEIGRPKREESKARERRWWDR